MRLCFVFNSCNAQFRRSQWPRGLWRRSAAARLLRSWVRIPPGAWMFVSCDCCVLLGRGLCDELITRPGESYRLWCVVVCDLETSRMRRPRPALGRSATAKKKPSFILTKLNAAFVFIFSLYLVTFIAKTPQMYGSSCEEPWELANSVLGFFK